jgi:hypothetical protein
MKDSLIAGQQKFMSMRNGLVPAGQPETTITGNPIMTGTTSQMENLTAEECKKLEGLETIIRNGQKAFVEAGKALEEIRDKRLYRMKHKTFEGYCQDQWDFRKSHANRLILAAEAYCELHQHNPQFDLTPNGAINITESLMRPLTLLKTPEERQRAWNRAVKEVSNPKDVTAKVVKKAIGKVPTYKHKQATTTKAPTFTNSFWHILEHNLEDNETVGAKLRDRRVLEQAIKEFLSEFQFGIGSDGFLLLPTGQATDYIGSDSGIYTVRDYIRAYESQEFPEALILVGLCPAWKAQDVLSKYLSCIHQECRGMQIYYLGQDEERFYRCFQSVGPVYRVYSPTEPGTIDVAATSSYGEAETIAATADPNEEELQTGSIQEDPHTPQTNQPPWMQSGESRIGNGFSLRSKDASGKNRTSSSPPF